MIRATPVLPLAFVAFLAVGCGGTPADSGAAGAKPLEAAATLYGRWRIVAIDGAAPLGLESADAAYPHLIFSPSRYGGGTGCNSFGGTGLVVGDRWFGEPPIATEQGCGRMEAQQRTIIGIAAGGPVIRFQGRAEATLSTAKGVLSLRREAGAASSDPAADPLPLAGTAWEVRTIDAGQLRDPGLLTFEADRWTLNGPCAPLSGDWRQADRSIAMNVTSQPPRGCSAAERPADEALRAMIAAGPRYVTGPNREIVFVGGGHWLTAQFDRTMGRDDKDILRGEWRVDAVDGAAPATSEKKPSLAFGDASYAIWDGCNHTEGILATFARQLFTHGSGVSTLAPCPPNPLRARIRRIVADNPRIAKTGTGGLALVSPSGSLRMTRLSGRSFGTGEQFGLRAPTTISLRDPSARLDLLTGKRFAVVLDCGTVEGDWRGGQPARFSADPLQRTAPRCAGDPGSDAFRLAQFFTGNVLAVTGPNRDIVLLVNEDESMAGRIAR